MIGLVLSEFRRILSRRSFRLIGALAVFGVLLSAGIVFARSSKDPNSGLAEAQRQITQCEQSRASAIANGTFKPPPGALEPPPSCPTLADIRPAFDKRFVYAQTIPDVARHIAIPLFFIVFAVGASFVGAEWGSGTMTTMLTWEPRRGRVLAAKTIACLVTLAVAVVVLLAFLALVYLPIGALRGSTAGIGGAFWQHLSAIWLRAAGLALFGASLGVGLATLTRNTAGAAGIGFLYGAILDPLFGQLFKGRFRPWLFQHLLPRLMGIPVEGPTRALPAGGTEVISKALTATRPVVLLSIYAAGLLAVAYASFRTRDVT